MSKRHRSPRTVNAQSPPQSPPELSILPPWVATRPAASVPGPTMAPVTPPPPLTPLERLRRVKLARVQLEHAAAASVADARADGQTWARVGHALGVTQQAASKRYGP